MVESVSYTPDVPTPTPEAPITTPDHQEISPPLGILPVEITTQFQTPEQQKLANDLVTLMPKKDEILANKDNRPVLRETLQKVMQSARMPQPFPTADQALNESVGRALLASYNKNNKAEQKENNAEEKHESATQDIQEVIVQNADTTTKTVEKTQEQIANEAQEKLKAQEAADKAAKEKLKNDQLSDIDKNLKSLTLQSPDLAKIAAPYDDQNFKIESVNKDPETAKFIEQMKELKLSDKEQILMLKSRAVGEWLVTNQKSDQYQDFYQQNNGAIQNFYKSYNDFAESNNLPPLKNAIEQPSPKDFDNNPERVIQGIENKPEMLAKLPGGAKGKDAIAAAMMDFSFPELTDADGKPLPADVAATKLIETQDQIKKWLDTKASSMPVFGYLKNIAHTVPNSLLNGTTLDPSKLAFDDQGAVKVPIDFQGIQSNLNFTADGRLYFPDPLHYDLAQNQVKYAETQLPYSSSKLSEYTGITSRGDFTDAFKEKLKTILDAKKDKKEPLTPDVISEVALTTYQETYQDFANELAPDLKNFDQSIIEDAARKQIQVQKSASYYQPSLPGDVIRDRKPGNENLLPSTPDGQAIKDYLLTYNNPLLTAEDRQTLASTEAKLQGILKNDQFALRTHQYTDNVFAKYFIAPTTGVSEEEGVLEDNQAEIRRDYPSSTNYRRNPVDLPNLVNTTPGAMTKFVQLFANRRINGRDTFGRNDVQAFSRWVDLMVVKEDPQNIKVKRQRILSTYHLPKLAQEYDRADADSIITGMQATPKWP